MIVFDIISAFLIIYLLLYCIYRLVFFIKAKNIESFFEEQESKRSTVSALRKICVLIYTQGKSKNLNKLLEVLANQSYDKENYEVHVAFKKEENDPLPSAEFGYGAVIHYIENPDYFTKDKAINLLIEKMIPEKNFDAYVFLGENRTVGERYLENINKSLTESCVLVGSKLSVNEKNKFSKRVKNAIMSSYLKYTNRTDNLVRAMYNLAALIDGENFVLTSDILEKTGVINTETKTQELELSLYFITNDIKITYSPYIITAVNVKQYDFSNPSLKDKISLFARYFPMLAFKDFSFKEFVLFLLKPNSAFVLFSYIALAIVALGAPNHIEKSAVLVLGLFLLFNLIFSVNVSKMRFHEILWLCFYPLCLSWQKIKILINNLTMRSIIKSEYEEENVNSATISAVVNNGKRDFTAKLDLVSEDGMRKVIYREGNRFIATDSFLRMYDALEDITYRLASKKLILKTCQNCQYFSIQPDGTLDCLNGKCQISQNEILVWNGCQYFKLHTDKENREL